MARPDAAAIRSALSHGTATRLAELECFASIDSTNTFLKGRPLPAPGRVHAAIADHQTAGRGRRERRWLSAPGRSLCLSIAVTLGSVPGNLPALTLALGVGIAEALAGIGAADVRLKWPNDLMIASGKLGGILTESQVRSPGSFGVVAGVGINLELPDSLEQEIRSEPDARPAALASATDAMPERDALAVIVLEAMIGTCDRFSAEGFEAYREAFAERDWLHGREVVVDTGEGEVSGTGAGVDASGALLLDTAGDRRRIVAGTVGYPGHDGAVT